MAFRVLAWQRLLFGFMYCSMHMTDRFGPAPRQGVEAGVRIEI
jgi:hypothetical protein